MGAKHNIEILQEDLLNLIEKERQKILSTLRDRRIRVADKEERVDENLTTIKTEIKLRTQVEMQRLMRIESVNSSFISTRSDEAIEEEEAKQFVQDVLEQTNEIEIDQIREQIDIEKIPTKNSKTRLFKVNMPPRHKTEVTLKKNGKDTKMSLTSAFHFISRTDNPDSHWENPVRITRKVPQYLQEEKKLLDYACKKIRDMNEEFQTKCSFNLKANQIIAKYRERGDKEWMNIEENQDEFNDEIREILNDINRTYVIDERIFMKQVISLRRH